MSMGLRPAAGSAWAD